MATSRARLLFGSYRRGDANDPDVYVAAIAAVLACYDDELMRRVTDPRTGIQTDECYATWPPNAGELKAYCDAERDRAERTRRLAALPPVRFARLPPPRRAKTAGCRATVLVDAGAPEYAGLLERAQRPETDFAEWRMADDGRGLWVARRWVADGRRPFHPAREAAE